MRDRAPCLGHSAISPSRESVDANLNDAHAGVNPSDARPNDTRDGVSPVKPMAMHDSILDSTIDSTEGLDARPIMSVDQVRTNNRAYSTLTHLRLKSNAPSSCHVVNLSSSI